MTDAVAFDADMPLALATPADAQNLAATHAEAFEAPWDTDAFTALLGQAGVFGVVGLDGFILCRVVMDEAEVLTLVVRPAARRRGLARRLTQGASRIARGRGAERLFLEVAEDNVAALGLYRGTGFVETGRRRGYYETARGRTDALILVLNLCGDASHGGPPALS